LYARFGGLRKPGEWILGSDISGIIEAAGRGIRRFHPGDAVFGETLRYSGGLAEYACMREGGLALKPDWMSFEEAAALPQGAVIALQGLRDKGKVMPGQSVLINGGGGSAGMYAVQLAKYYGAEVTGVDNATKLDFMRSIGADHVIDYHSQDFTKSGSEFDFILDLVATRNVFSYSRALKPGGSYYAVGGSVSSMLQIVSLGSLITRRSGKKIRLLAVRPNPDDLIFITELCKEGRVIPYIDKRFSLDQAPEAMRYFGAGKARGKVVIIP
jgi:NADPH:quinone reductase-like Zn-dependent oxidoreductase